ncbi:MAG TPA: tetratricopeptide repeat protein, partial [Nitrospira sp.]|nr:tetratricopeptide repeat protein [Nitrospira sp.]
MHKIRTVTLHFTRLALVLLVAGGLLLMTKTTGTIAAGEASPETFMKQGLHAYQRGAFDKALGAWKEAAQLYEQAGKPMEQSRALVAAAQASEAMGQVTQALQQLEVALALAQKSDDKVWTATVLSSLGHAYLAGRQPDAAMQHLKQALETAPQSATAVIAGIHNNTGLAQVAEKKLPEALTSFAEAANKAAEAGDRPLTVRTRINAGRTALALNQPEASRDWFDKALDELKDFEPSHEKATSLIQIGLGYHQLRTLMPANGTAILLRAAGAFVEAGDVAKKVGDVRTKSYADGYLGHLYETEHRYEEGLQLTRQAVFSAQAANAPESLYRWEWQLGRLLADTGKLDEAITAYYRAADALKPIRMEVASAMSIGSGSGEESIRPLFFEQADLLFQRATLTADAKAAEDYLRHARDAIEDYKAAELRDYFRDQCVDALQAKLTRLDTISPSTVVIYPIVFADRTELLASFSSGMRRYSVPVTSVELTKVVRSFRRTVEKRTTLEYLEYSQQLYDWLIRPLESDLIRHKIQTLVFVPDGALRTIPFSALHDGKSFLIQQYGIAMTPGLYLTDPRPLNLEKIRTLAGGLISSV